jgi:predicted dehydrogenase
MSQRTLGFGLVGAGGAARTHARQLREISGAELVAIHGRDEHRLKSVAQDIGAKRWYTDFRRLLDDKDVDVIDIVTPHGLHRDFAVAAADRGKHVLVEKPIEISLDRADAIIGACKRNGVKLGVVYQMRFGEAVQQVKRTVDAGRFGKVVLGSAYDKGFRSDAYYDNWKGSKPLAGGGSVMTSTIHVIDLLLWLMGPVRSVFAKKATRAHDTEVEDVGAALLTFASGAFGVVESTTASYPSQKAWVEVHGDTGTAIVSGEYDQMLLWHVRDSGVEIDAPQGFRFEDTMDPAGYPETRQRSLLEDFIHAVQDDREPLVTGEEGRKSLAFVLAMYESAESGTEVTVPQ